VGTIGTAVGGGSELQHGAPSYAAYFEEPVGLSRLFALLDVGGEEFDHVLLHAAYRTGGLRVAPAEFLDRVLRARHLRRTGPSRSASTSSTK
jgi:hypothetical protein